MTQSAALLEEIKKFQLLSQAWYGPSQLVRERYIDELIAIGSNDSELVIRWYKLQGRPCICLETFLEDGLDLIPAFLGILAKHEAKNPTPKDLANWLAEEGAVDTTPSAEPYTDEFWG